MRSRERLVWSIPESYLILILTWEKGTMTATFLSHGRKKLGLGTLRMDPACARLYSVIAFAGCSRSTSYRRKSIKNRRQVLYVRWSFRLIIGWGSYQFEKNNVHLIKMQSVWRACPVRVSLLFLVCFFCGLRKKLFGRKKKAPFRNKTTKSHCMLNIPFV